MDGVISNAGKILRHFELPFSVCHFSFVIGTTAFSRDDK
jgi:hypothetical protein